MEVVAVAVAVVLEELKVENELKILNNVCVHVCNSKWQKHCMVKKFNVPSDGT